MAIYANSNDPISPNVDPASWSCGGIPTPENTGGQNFSAFCDPAFDELIPQIAVETDPAKRLELKHDAVRLFTDATFYVGLYPRLTWYAISTDVVDTTDLQGMIGTLSSNWFEKIEYWKPAGM
jgi:ABC-type transport system substrate-binding protein